MVDDERIPHLCSCLPTVSPLEAASTMKAVIPFAFDTVVSVRAKTIISPACEPLVIQILVPFKTQRSPFRSAFVRRFAESLPACGSVSA